MPKLIIFQVRSLTKECGGTKLNGLRFKIGFQQILYNEICPIQNPASILYRQLQID